jgi:hypothetical protein
MTRSFAPAAACRVLSTILIALVAAVGAPSFCSAANPSAVQTRNAPAAANQQADSQLVPAALPPWAASSTTGQAAAATAAPPKQGITPAPAKEVAPIASKKAETPPPAVAASGSTAPPGSATDGQTLLQSPLTVVRWGFSATAQPDDSGGFSIVARAGRPLQLWLTIEGGQTAIAQLQAAGRLAIDVHWQRADKSAGPGGPDLNTELTIGRPGLASIFAGQVQRQGHFQWHLWSRKDALSPGQWIVSLTYPDGTPVRCGQAMPQPCRLSVSAG